MFPRIWIEEGCGSLYMQTGLIFSSSCILSNSHPEKKCHITLPLIPGLLSWTWIWISLALEESQCSGLGPPHNGGWELHMKGVWFAYSHSRLSFYTNPVSSLPPFVQLWKIRGGITSLKRKWSIVFPRENSRRQKDRVVSTAASSWLAYTWKLFQNKPGVECKAAQAFHNCCVCCWNLSRSNGPKHADSLGLPCVFLSCVQQKETAEDFWKFVFGAIYTKAEVNYCRIVRIK